CCVRVHAGMPVTNTARTSSARAQTGSSRSTTGAHSTKEAALPAVPGSFGASPEPKKVAYQNAIPRAGFAASASRPPGALLELPMRGLAPLVGASTSGTRAVRSPDEAAPPGGPNDALAPPPRHAPPPAGARLRALRRRAPRREAGLRRYSGDRG